MTRTMLAHERTSRCLLLRIASLSVWCSPFSVDLNAVNNLPFMPFIIAIFLYRVSHPHPPHSPRSSPLHCEQANNGGINASPSTRHSTTQRGSGGRSMSPPPGRSSKQGLSRAELASRKWKATTADPRRANSAGTLLDPPRYAIYYCILCDRSSAVLDDDM